MNDTMNKESPNNEPVRLPPIWIRLPNTAFGIALGLAGQAAMWSNLVGNMALVVDDTPAQTINFIMWWGALLTGYAFVGLYILKAFFHREFIYDEYTNSARAHFLNMPHLIAITLNISVPERYIMGDGTGRRVLWVLCFLTQLVFTQGIYQRWMFSETHSLSCAKPQFLLSTVGWFMLSVLGSQLDIESAWGIPFPSFCLGAGMVFYLMVTVSILSALHHNPKAKGSPALFLLIAPPSLGVIAMDLIRANNEVNNDNFSESAEMLLGWCLVIVLLLFRIGPTIAANPPALGAYWAYVFPSSALASAITRYAIVEQSEASRVMAISFITIATLAILIVMMRELYHTWLVLTTKEQWGDPLIESKLKPSPSLPLTIMSVDQSVTGSDETWRQESSIEAA